MAYITAITVGGAGRHVVTIGGLFLDAVLPRAKGQGYEAPEAEQASDDVPADDTATGNENR